MAIIEKGLDVKDLNIGSISKWAALRAGMLMVGLGMGSLVGSVSSNGAFNEGIGIVSFALGVGGVMLVLNFFVEMKWRK